MRFHRLDLRGYAINPSVFVVPLVSFSCFSLLAENVYGLDSRMQNNSTNKNIVFNFGPRIRSLRLSRGRLGFTLTELLVASLIASFVIMLAWTGLFSVMNMSSEAQAITARKLDLSNALDLLTEEVREAQSINRSGDMVANGLDVTLKDVVAHAGLSPQEIGNPGDIALFLELPTNSAITSCMTESGPHPAETVDRVVYDVRDSPVSWLPPEVVARYGRIPESDGSINPCSRPVANDIVADSIAAVDAKPSCDGVLSGGKGFHTCQKGDSVDLLLKSSISKLDDLPLKGSVTSRATTFVPTADNDSPLDKWEIVLTKNGHHDVSFEWVWTDDSTEPDPPSVEEFTIEFEGRETVRRKRGLLGRLLDSHHTTEVPKIEYASISGQDTRQFEQELDNFAHRGNGCLAVAAQVKDFGKRTSNKVCF